MKIEIVVIPKNGIIYYRIQFVFLCHEKTINTKTESHYNYWKEDQQQ